MALPEVAMALLRKSAVFQTPRAAVHAIAIPVDDAVTHPSAFRAVGVQIVPG